MKNRKVYRVTLVSEEEGTDLTTQYIVMARSYKSAIEQVLDTENITIEEIKTYGDTKNTNVEN